MGVGSELFRHELLQYTKVLLSHQLREGEESDSSEVLPFETGKVRCVVVKAKVNQSQRSPDNAHLIAKMEGGILLASRVMATAKKIYIITLKQTLMIVYP